VLQIVEERDLGLGVLARENVPGVGFDLELGGELAFSDPSEQGGELGLGRAEGTVVLAMDRHVKVTAHFEIRTTGRRREILPEVIKVAELTARIAGEDLVQIARLVEVSECFERSRSPVRLDEGNRRRHLDLRECHAAIDDGIQAGREVFEFDRLMTDVETNAEVATAPSGVGAHQKFGLEEVEKRVDALEGATGLRLDGETNAGSGASLDVGEAESRGAEVANRRAPSLSLELSVSPGEGADRKVAAGVRKGREDLRHLEGIGEPFGLRPIGRVNRVFDPLGVEIAVGEGIHGQCVEPFGLEGASESGALIRGLPEFGAQSGAKVEPAGRGVGVGLGGEARKVARESGAWTLPQ
jgi:hypothetical protein